MNKPFALSLAVLASLALASCARAQGMQGMPGMKAEQPQTQPPARVVEGRQGRNPVVQTEVKPGVWVHGRPDKPIYSGSMPIYPEIYDFEPPRGK